MRIEIFMPSNPSLEWRIRFTKRNKQTLSYLLIRMPIRWLFYIKNKQKNDNKIYRFDQWNYSAYFDLNYELRQLTNRFFRTPSKFCKWNKTNHSMILSDHSLIKNIFVVKKISICQLWFIMTTKEEEEEKNIVLRAYSRWK